MCLSLSVVYRKTSVCSHNKTWNTTRKHPTLTFLGQLVSGFPVFIAAQDVVGDVHMAGCHVVDALGNGHTSRGRSHHSSAAADRTDRRWTQGHGRWGTCAPVRRKMKYRPMRILEIQSTVFPHHFKLTRHFPYPKTDLVHYYLSNVSGERGM